MTQGGLRPMVNGVRNNNIACQRFGALGIGNLATNVANQVRIVQEGAIQPLVQLSGDMAADTEARRYSVLALANLAATIGNHPAILEEKALFSLFTLRYVFVVVDGGWWMVVCCSFSLPLFSVDSLCSLSSLPSRPSLSSRPFHPPPSRSNSPDILSQYYVAYALANLAANERNHLHIVQEGGLQPCISLAYSPDPDVHHQAAAALRGLAVNDENKLKIVQEGGLEPLTLLTRSTDVEILREVSFSSFVFLLFSRFMQFFIKKMLTLRHVSPFSLLFSSPQT